MYKTSLILTTSSSCAMRSQFLASTLPSVSSLKLRQSDEGWEELNPASGGQVRRSQNQLLSLELGQILYFMQ